MCFQSPSLLHMGQIPCSLILPTAFSFRISILHHIIPSIVTMWSNRPSQIKSSWVTALSF
jgi:hypothetical protein